MGNNRAEAWQIVRRSGITDPLLPSYSVALHYDDFFPATDGTGVVHLKVTVSRKPTSAFLHGFVAIALAPGLSAGTPMFAINDTPGTEPMWSTTLHLSYSSGRFEIGTMASGGTTRDTNQPIDGEKTVSMTLPLTVASGAVLEEQCVTAEVFAQPPAGPGRFYDDGSDNRAKLCLGKPGIRLFQSGQIDTFTIYPCVGNTDPPCDATDDVRVRAVDKTVEPERILVPSTVVININERQARTYDGHLRNNILQSVNDGNTVSWQTVRSYVDAGNHRQYSYLPGVQIGFSRMPFNNHLSSWSRHSGERIVVRGVDGGDPPGSMHIRAGQTANILSKMNAGNSWTATYNGSTSSTQPTVSTPWYAEFEQLGTYIVEYTTRNVHATNPGDCDFDTDGSNESFCATETYTFHVGPLADLEIRSGPPTPNITGQHLVIEALNHGPDAVKGARIPLDFLDPANILEVIPSEGHYHETQRVWYLPQHQNAGAFRTTGYRRSAGQPSAATLTIRTRGLSGNPAQPVTIASYQDYEVCIASDGTDLPHTDQTTCEAVSGASWHTTPYYDYKPANNEAQLTLHATGGNAELTAVEREGVVGFRWTAQADAVTYGLEVSTDGETWTHLVSGLTDTGLSYTGLLPAGQTRYYRVYSVNEAGEHSMPFATARTTSGSGGGGGTRIVVVGGGGGTRTVEVSPTGPRRVTATSRGPTGILVYWSGPPHLYGDAVTSYELEVSQDQDHWRTVAPYVERAESTGDGTQPATKYTHTGLTPGTTYYYRVYAHNRRGRSLASPVVAATTDEPRPLTGVLDHPPPQATLSGIGAVYGWECDAEEVIVHINGTPHPAVTGLERRDTQGVCGDTDNGFELLLNWNTLGAGLHDIRVFVDGTELARARVDVTTFGTPFLSGAHGTCQVPDFPTPGETVTLEWQEARQHFVMTDGRTPPTFSATGDSSTPGYLDQPAANSWQSGIGLLSGWVCEADEVRVQINGAAMSVPYGLERPDTQDICGDTANGFGRVFNWADLGSGEHTVAVLVDGEVLDRATVWVKTWDIPADAAGQCTVPGFPGPGDSVTLTWQPDQQQFGFTTIP